MKSTLLQRTCRRCDRPFTSRSSRPTSAVEAPTHAATVEESGPRFKASIDFKFLKDNVDLMVKNTRDRSSSADPKLVVQLYDKYIQLKQEADLIRAERNENSGAMKVHTAEPS